MSPEKVPANWREVRRMRAWELKQQGWRQNRIAEALGVSEGAVPPQTWLALVDHCQIETPTQTPIPTLPPLPDLPEPTPEERARIGAELAHYQRIQAARAFMRRYEESLHALVGTGVKALPPLATIRLDDPWS